MYRDVGRHQVAYPYLAEEYEIGAILRLVLALKNRKKSLFKMADFTKLGFEL